MARGGDIACLSRTVLAALALSAGVSVLAGCHKAPPEPVRSAEARDFPRADRPVAPADPTETSSEDQRDHRAEAKVVMDMAAIAPGMTVADIGAGAGYYTVRLAPRVGKKGRVLAEDIDPAILTKLGDRVARERLDNVSIAQGSPANPHLPAASFDRIFLVHMYHEVDEPYAFLWYLRQALRPHGAVIVVDVDKPTDRHGIPPALLFCEFAAVGYRLAEFDRKPELTGYYAKFEAVGESPIPAAIKACRADVHSPTHED